MTTVDENQLQDFNWVPGIRNRSLKLKGGPDTGKVWVKDLLVEGAGWNEQLLRDKMEEEDCSEILKIIPTFDAQMDDKWCWNMGTRESAEKVTSLTMAFRSREMMKKIVKKIGGEQNLAPAVKEQLKKSVPDRKVVMGRAHRGLFAGRHIQFGNRVSEDGGNKTRRSWKPNVQEKRLFSYILDRHIRVKVTTHALRCIDKAGGIDEYLLKTPYHKMDTEMGLFWKTKIEKMYQELGEMEVVFFSPEDEDNFEKQFEELKLEKKAARREARRKMYGSSYKHEVAEDGGESGEGGEEVSRSEGRGGSHPEFDEEQTVANA
ncbi:Ribosomal L28 family [Striga hermonthica]|uniref:Large ribosomal subunit protein bL28m n=1 Tax=Striga hermonthica TaxID=68872 RepID=A0A9N7MMH8_STRHE|nr:Ribosomal L28 family [Striga hermonthica]